MNWLDKLKGKAGQPAQGADKPRQEAPRPAAGTVVRAGAHPAPTIAKAGPRFGVNDEVTADFQIKSLLGSGGMGEVYLARQRMWDVDIALKIPNDEILSDPENRHRIVREAEAWTDLGLHPNIAYCYYAQPLGELLLLVIEYVDGGNLRDWIADGRCADLKTGMDLAIQFCHGLEHAHKKGLIHRDIKPENVLLMKDGTLKITDFGIVRKALASPERLQSSGATRGVAAGMTTVGIGTADYMAPEQWGDQSEIDHRADIFAFGVCLYEMLCGGRPYATTAGQRQEAPDPGKMRGGKGLPAWLSLFMKRCVDWDPKRRPANAEEMRRALCLVYQDAFGEQSRYADLPELLNSADDWNNRALSYLALGRAEDAERAWQTALEADPQHTESTYNHGLHRWRKAKATDRQVLASLGGVVESNPSAWLPRYLSAQIHLERGDTDGALLELSNVPEDREAEEELALARRTAAESNDSSRLVRAFGAHANSVCFDSEGKQALSGGLTADLALWDVQTGCCLRTFEGHTESVESVSLSQDGRIALSGSVDRTLKVWDAATGGCLGTLKGHLDRVTSVCLSGDGRYALSGSADKTVKLWDVATGRCLRTLDGHSRDVHSVFLSGNGRHALSGSVDKTLKLWDVATGRCLRTFSGHSSWVESVFWAGDGQYGISGSDDCTVKLWELASGRCIRTFEGHTGSVRSVCLSADRSFVLSGSDDSTVRLWALASGRCLRTFEGHKWKVNSVCLSVGGRSALSGGLDRTLNLWRIGSFGYRANFRLGRMRTSAESIAAAGRYAQALSDARDALSARDTVRTCESLRRARRERDFRREPIASQAWGSLYVHLRRSELTDSWLCWKIVKEHFSAVSLSTDCRSVLLGSYVGELQLREVPSGRWMRTFSGHTGSVLACCLTADGRYALSGSDDKTMRLWDVGSGRCLRTFEGHSEGVRAVCLSADDRFALTDSEDKTMKLWNVGSGRCLRTFEGHSKAIHSISLSGDCRYALWGGADFLKLWQVSSGRCVRTFKKSRGAISSASLSADGRLVLSGDSNALKVWDVGTGRCLQTFEGHSQPVKSVSLSGDGRYALSGSEDRTLKLWEVKSGRCLRTLAHDRQVGFVAWASDSQYAFAVSNNEILAWFLDWEMDENAHADWDEGARPHLDVFLRAHQPYAGSLPKDRQPTDEEVTRALTRQGGPEWTEEDFQKFLYTLGCAGYGWLRPEGVRRELVRMAAAWKDPE